MTELSIHDELKNELNSSIENVLAELRQKALLQFTREIVSTLKGGGYHFDEILYALADYADAHLDCNSVVNHLEEATSEARKARLERNHHNSPIQDKSN